MFQIVGKLLGYTTHLLSFCLVSCFCFLFVYFTDYTLFTLIAAHHQPSIQSWIVDILLTIFLLYFGLNIFFNYFMTMLTSPGTSKDIDSETILQTAGYCNKCLLTKPQRTHHCSICDKCVFAMDHHCPWMWNCIGHFNRRYFVSFLTTLSVELLFIWILNLTLDQKTKQSNQFIRLFDILIGVVFGVITAFAVFHWYLILSGKTSLQLCSQENYLDSFTWLQRFQTIFGSKNILIPFTPNLIELKYDGIHWQRQTPY